MIEQTNKAIQRIIHAYEIAQNMGNMLICAYSGGKDSDVLLDLAIKSGVPFVAQHNHTTVDAPETVYHIREVFANLKSQGIPTRINFPPEIETVDGKRTRATMWNLIPKKRIPPTRRIRYCCEYFKERQFDGQHVLTGVRWAESARRRGRGLHEKLHRNKEKRIIYMDENDDAQKLFDICHKKARVATNPIIDWTDSDIWTYIQENNIPMNPLYARGWKRIGCLGCPMAAKSNRELSEYPKYRAAYLRAFERMRQVREERGLDNIGHFKSAETAFDWWSGLITKPK